MAISFKNTAEKFGLTARAFHWLIAVLILMLLMMGYQMGTLPMGPDKLWVIGLHKSLGITVLALGIMRLIWRILNAPPPALPSHAKWEKILAKTIHGVFYLSIIGMPLSGWIMSSASEYPVTFFGWFNMPSIVAKNHDLAEAMEEVHELFALGLMGSVALHIAGALKHRLIDKDDTLKRMGANIVIAALGLIWLGVVALVMLSGEGKEHEHAHAEVQQTQADVHVSGDGNWSIQKEASVIEFMFSQYGQSVKSNFANWDGQIVFDKGDLSASHADIRIDAASLKTGSDDRDRQSQGPDWFDTARFPVISFQSESFKDLGSNQYEMTGTLNVRDVAKPVSVPFTLDFESQGQGRKKAVMDGTLKLNRLDYGVGQGRWQATDGIANEVTIRLHVEAFQNP